MPKPSTYNPDSLAILVNGPGLPLPGQVYTGGAGALTWQVYSYADGPARVRFVAPRGGGEPRKVDHFDADSLLALVALAPGAREALLSVQSPSPSAPDPERAQLLSELSRLRAQVAQFAAGRPAPSAPAAVAPAPTPAPHKAKRPAPAPAPSAVPSVAAARAAIMGS